MTSEPAEEPSAPASHPTTSKMPAGARLQGILKLSGVIITAFSASAVVAAVVSGLFASAENKQEFLRDQRVAAYSTFLTELLSFEETYETGRKLLEPLPGEEPPGEASPASVSADLGAGLDKIRAAKAAVDILGTPDMMAEAEKAIELYGPYKGQMQEDLEILKEDLAEAAQKTTLERQPLKHKNHAAKNTDMQKCAREPFSDQERKDLGVEHRPAGPVACLPHPDPLAAAQ
jgi:hypothetical protein